MSLIRTIQSIKNQTDSHWKLIIVFDGIDQIHQDILNESNDDRIILKQVEKQEHRSQIRNIGIALADTPWVSFIDDDDTISNDYIEKLRNEEKTNECIDCVIFRQYFGDSKFEILPKLNCKSLKCGKVGISFAVKRKVFDTIQFKNTYPFIEDFKILKTIHINQFNIVVCPHVCYFSRREPFDSSHLIGHRVLNPEFIY